MPNLIIRSGRRVSGHCLCGAVELEIDFPAFGPGTITTAASRLAHGAAYATYIGCWRKHARVSKGRRSIARFEDAKTGATRSFCSRCGTPLLYERKRSPYMVNIRGRSSPRVPAASPATTWPSRSFRIGLTPANGLSPSRAIPISPGNARNHASARAMSIMLRSSTGASGPHAPESFGEGIYTPGIESSWANHPSSSLAAASTKTDSSGIHAMSYPRLRPAKSFLLGIAYQHFSW